MIGVLFANALTLILLTLFAMMPHAKASDCLSTDSNRRTTRFPVVMRSPDWLFGSRTTQIEAWKYSQKSWERVDLQVDEVNREGSYVLDQGMPFTSGTDDGYLDENDELSVLGSNFGSPFKAKEISKELKLRFNKFRRVDFCDAKSGYYGSLLIGVTFSSKESRNFTPLFSQANNEVNTTKYRYVFRKNHPMLMGDVKVKTNTGEESVFEGSSFVMPLKPRVFIFPTLNFGESDFTSEIECWRSGPVRSIVAVGSKMRKFFSLIDLHLFSELIFYDDYFQIPTKIEFIFDPSTYLAAGSGLSYILKLPTVANWRFDSNLADLPKSGPVEGKLKISAFDAAQNGTFLVKGSSEVASFIAHVRVDQKALKQSPPPYMAQKEAFTDKELLAKWPWLGRGDGSLGVFIDISRVNTGIYDFALDVALSNQANDQFIDFQPLSAKWPDAAEFDH